MKAKNSEKMVAVALRNYADTLMDNADNVTVDEGKALDRALRSCPGISGIDVVWVRWRFVAIKKGWLTDSELIFNRGKYTYPEVKE